MARAFGIVSGGIRGWATLLDWNVLNDSFVYTRLGNKPNTLSIHLEGPVSRRNLGTTVWDCRVEVPGYWEEVLFSANSPIQATCLALRYLRGRLSKLMSEGTLAHPGGAAVQLEELFCEASE